MTPACLQPPPHPHPSKFRPWLSRVRASFCKGPPDPTSVLSLLLFKSTGLWSLYSGSEPLSSASPCKAGLGKSASVRCLRCSACVPQTGSGGRQYFHRRPQSPITDTPFTISPMLIARTPLPVLIPHPNSKPRPFLSLQPKPTVGTEGTSARQRYLPCRPHPDLPLLQCPVCGACSIHPTGGRPGGPSFFPPPPKKKREQVGGPAAARTPAPPALHPLAPRSLLRARPAGETLSQASAPERLLTRGTRGTGGPKPSSSGPGKRGGGAAL